MDNCKPKAKPTLGFPLGLALALGFATLSSTKVSREKKLQLLDTYTFGLCTKSNLDWLLPPKFGN